MKPGRYIDLNADLGEGAGNDSVLMPFLDSCSIACGGHAGNLQTIRDVLELAQLHAVKSGAHPSYPDPEYFGRRVLEISQEDLMQSLIRQLQTYRQVSESLSISINHVKLHGALYHQANRDEQVARVIWQALSEAVAPTKIYLPPESVMRSYLPSGWQVCTEAFIDRGYQSDLSLVPRSQTGAMIHSTQEAWQRYQDLSIRSGVRTIKGEFRNLKADTACIHGDNPRALEMARFIQENRSA